MERMKKRVHVKKLVRKPKIDVNTKKLFLDALKNPLRDSKDAYHLLNLACCCDRDDIVKPLLLDENVDLNRTDENGQSPVFYAVINGSIDCFNILLQNDVDLEIKDNDDKYTLTYAVEGKEFLIVDKLLKKITNPMILNDIIRFVIAAKKSEALAILADYDCIDVSAFYGDLCFVDKKHYTALHYASKRGFVTSVSKLVLDGRIVHRNVKETPMALAASYNQYEVMSILFTAGMFVSTDLKFLRSSKWNVFVNTPSKGKCKNGNNMHQLLDFLKQRLSHAVEGEELYIVCQNVKEHLDTLDVFHLDFVKHMTFVNCHMQHVPYFRNVERLAFSGCVVDSFENLRRFYHLKVLTIANCNLVELPGSLEHCQNICYLNINNNTSLNRLPPWILSLPLTHLSVHDNGLSEIPELLPKTLRVLNIQNNQIEKLSPFLGELSVLSSVSLHGNPLIFPELSIAKSKTRDLLLYLKAFLTDTVPNVTVKLSFVGKERAGKSTLLEALKSSNSMCEDHNNIAKTDGLEISNLFLDNIHLRAFDLAGDIDFIETHTMFVSEGTLFLAVFDLRAFTLNSMSTYFFGRIEIWLSSIYAQAPNSRVLLVGTHADGEMITPASLEVVWKNVSAILNAARANHVKDFTSNALQECLLCTKLPCIQRDTINGVAGMVKVSCDASVVDERSSIDVDVGLDTVEDIEEEDEDDKDFLRFPHIVGYYEVSTLKQIPRKVFSNGNESVERLKEAISHNTLAMLALTPCIPRKWLRLHEILVKKVEKHYPILSYQEFADIAQECGFNRYSNEDLEPFLRHFHSCGELLYYFDIDELCDIIIIDPQWLSNQLRSVISYHKSNLVEDGIIKHDVLHKSWQHLDEFDRCKLLALFRQAGIFIKFSPDADLIPCRLPIGRPSDDIWPANSTENQVDYMFEFVNLPPSFFSHIIAMVENKRDDFGGKMQPLYHSNHVVYNTKSPGIPCSNHTKDVVNIVEDTVDDVQKLLARGVMLTRFLSLDVNSIDSLLDAWRSSRVFSTVTSTDFVDFASPSEEHTQNRRHRIHMELIPHTRKIIVSIRGPTPCCIAPEAIDILNRVRLTRYNAITMEFFVLCPVCVRKSSQRPAKFSVEDIENHDPVCDRGHDLITWENVLTGTCDYRPVLTAQHLITSLDEYDCPRLFLMIPVNLHSVGFREFYTLTYLKEGFSVHLLCEYPDCWHYLSSPGYRLTRPREFVKKYGRRLQTLLRVLSKLEVPARLAGFVSETGNNVADLFASLNSLATDLDEHLTDVPEFLATFNTTNIQDDMRYLNSNDGLKRREFRKFLNKADEEKRFGDLIPTFIGDRVHWLCEEHHRLQVVP